MFQIISSLIICFLILPANTAPNTKSITMPPELRNHLFSFLTPEELLNLSQTTKRAQTKLKGILSNKDIENSYISIFGIDAWSRLSNRTKDDRFYQLVQGEVWEINKFGLTEKEVKETELRFCSGSGYHLEIINDYIRNHLEGVQNPVKQTLWTLFKHAMNPIIEKEKESKKINRFDDIILRGLKPFATLIHNKHLAQFNDRDDVQEIVPWVEVSNENKADVFILYYIHWRKYDAKYRDGTYNFPFFAGIRYILRGSNLIDIREIVLRKWINTPSKYFEDKESFNNFFKNSKRSFANDVADIFFMITNFGV